MRSKKKMTSIEFDAVRHLLKISDSRIEAARLVLVEGKTLQAVGDQFGWSRQAVGDTVNVVWRLVENYRASQKVLNKPNEDLPIGWEQVNLTAPSDLIIKFRKEIAEAEKAAKSDKKSPELYARGIISHRKQTKARLTGGILADKE